MAIIRRRQKTPEKLAREKQKRLRAGFALGAMAAGGVAGASMAQPAQASYVSFGWKDDTAPVAEPVVPEPVPVEPPADILPNPVQPIPAEPVAPPETPAQRDRVITPDEPAAPPAAEPPQAWTQIPQSWPAPAPEPIPGPEPVPAGPMEEAPPAPEAPPAEETPAPPEDLESLARDRQAIIPPPRLKEPVTEMPEARIIPNQEDATAPPHDIFDPSLPRDRQPTPEELTPQNPMEPTPARRIIPSANIQAVSTAHIPDLKTLLQSGNGAQFLNYNSNQNTIRIGNKIWDIRDEEDPIVSGNQIVFLLRNEAGQVVGGIVYEMDTNGNINPFNFSVQGYENGVATNLRFRTEGEVTTITGNNGAQSFTYTVQNSRSSHLVFTDNATGETKTIDFRIMPAYTGDDSYYILLYENGQLVGYQYISSEDMMSQDRDVFGGHYGGDFDEDALEKLMDKFEDPTPEILRQYRQMEPAVRPDSVSPYATYDSALGGWLYRALNGFTYLWDQNGSIVTIVAPDGSVTQVVPRTDHEGNPIINSDGTPAVEPRHGWGPGGNPFDAGNRDIIPPSANRGPYGGPTGMQPNGSFIWPDGSVSPGATVSPPAPRQK